MKRLLPALLALLMFSASSSAQFIWQKTYGPFNTMYLSKMIALKNGGYLLVGNQFAGPPAQVAPGYVVRTNENSDTLWVKKHLVSGANFTFCHDVVEDFDGNLLVVGDWGNNNASPVNYNAFLYKLNSNGDTLWTKRIITPQRDSFSSVIIGHDNTYLVSVVISGTSYIQKYNRNGLLVWSRAYPFSPSDVGKIGYLYPASNGYFVFVHSNYNETKICKINENGIEQYSKKNKFGSIHDVTTDAYQNFMVCANGGLSKLNPSGDTLWNKVYKRNNQFIGIKAAKPTIDGNYILLFGTYGYQDIGFMKVNSKGVLIKDTVLYRGGIYDYDFGKDIVLDNDGNYVFAGLSYVQNGDVVFLCKYRKWNQVIDTGDEEDEKGPVSGTNLYPNPATTQATITSADSLTGIFKLYDFQGKKIWQETVSNCTKKDIPMHSFSRGVYILKFYSENGSNFTRKVVKQ